MSGLIKFLKALLPGRAQDGLRSLKKKLAHTHPVGTVRFGSLRRVTPIGSDFGFDRGTCIDRYYIEAFLRNHASDIQGRVLEVSENKYTKVFGGDRVEQSDVLHAVEGNPEATFVDDLRSGKTIPDNTFDCILLTQTLHVIYEARDVVQTLHRILKPGGALFVSIPGISQISRYDMDRWGDYWRFTTRSATNLFGEFFPENKLEVRSHGNVLTAVSFLHGLAIEELKQEELDYHDPNFQLLLMVRAVK